MTIKKVFAPIFDVLNANPNAIVADIMPQLTELAKSATPTGTSAVRNEAGDVVGAKCNYFGKFFTIDNFGKKAGTPSGYNSYTKVGASLYSKQNSAFRAGKEQLLEDVVSGEVPAADIQLKLNELQEAKNFVAEIPEDMQAFNSSEELLAAI